MDNKTQLNPAEVRRTITDFVCVPVILLFALFSLGPLGGLMQGGGALKIGLNVFFLASGLYGVLAGAFLLKGLTWSHYRNQSDMGVNRVYLALYGGIWCVFYFIFLRISI